jgi:HaeII restriction endonuclease
MNLIDAKQALDSIIAKSRVHLYKPIQIAEILYQHRIYQKINLADLETYRNPSKVWRDVVTTRFVGRSSTSSAKYQEDIFSEKAMPPHALAVLGEENLAKRGIVEAYVYRRFSERFSQVSSGLQYCSENDRYSFDVTTFINLFWLNPGLKRSIDKIYEIIVYALFSTLVDALEVLISVSIADRKTDLLSEFADFTKMVIGLSPGQNELRLPARIYRLGVTNAADRGLDMYANFGMAIQIKHLSLTPALAENIVGSVTADRIVIVCKASEQSIIISLLTQIGWKSRIQSVVTEVDLARWYKQALRGRFGHELGERVLLTLREQIAAEFPATNNRDFAEFYEGRNYNLLTDDFWVS